MKTYLDCIPCFMQQSLRAGEIVTTDEGVIKKILDSTADIVKSISMESTPPETGMLVYRKIREITGVEDLYKDIKKQHILETKQIYPELEKMVEESDDRILTAIKIAIAGNIIDMGVNKNFDIVSDVRALLKQEFAVFDYSEFKSQLEKSKTILYIGDNAGESVFDKILIKELNRTVKYAVRSIPIINDAIMSDAIDSGLDEVAELIESGSEAPGTILELCNNEFKKLFTTADMVISKGQGNYEGLSDSDRSLFFLLKAKCPVISRHLGVEENSILLKGHNC